jgi:hypothetical protein
MTDTATPRRVGVTLALRPAARGTTLVDLDRVAQLAGLHPEVVRRLVRLGLLDRAGGTEARPLFPDDIAARLTRATRLRRDLALNYAGAVLACELLDRIEELEDRLSRYEPRTDFRR